MKKPFLFCMLLFLACSNQSIENSSTSTSSPEPVLGEIFTLRVGESANVNRGALRVTLVALEEDSRCPTNLTCIWEGNAAVRVQLDSPQRAEEEVVLNTHFSRPRLAQRDNHTVTLLSVDPHPTDPPPSEEIEYRAQFKVAID